jgi:hypothetical protein
MHCSYAAPYIVHVVPLYQKEIDGCGRLHLFGVVVKCVKSKDAVLVEGGRSLWIPSGWNVGREQSQVSHCIGLVPQAAEILTAQVKKPQNRWLRIS